MHEQPASHASDDDTIAEHPVANPEDPKTRTLPTADKPLYQPHFFTFTDAEITKKIAQINALEKKREAKTTDFAATDQNAQSLSTNSNNATSSSAPVPSDNRLHQMAKDSDRSVFLGEESELSVGPAPIPPALSRMAIAGITMSYLTNFEDNLINASTAQLADTQHSPTDNATIIHVETKHAPPDSKHGSADQTILTPSNFLKPPLPRLNRQPIETHAHAENYSATRKKTIKCMISGLILLGGGIALVTRDNIIAKGFSGPFFLFGLIAMGIGIKAYRTARAIERDIEMDTPSPTPIEHELPTPPDLIINR